MRRLVRIVLFGIALSTAASTLVALAEPPAAPAPAPLRAKILGAQEVADGTILVIGRGLKSGVGESWKCRIVAPDGTTVAEVTLIDVGEKETRGKTSAPKDTVMKYTEVELTP